MNQNTAFTVAVGLAVIRFVLEYKKQRWGLAFKQSIVMAVATGAFYVAYNHKLIQSHWPYLLIAFLAAGCLSFQLIFRDKVDWKQFFTYSLLMAAAIEACAYVVTQ
jgi:hypothetical protein